MFKVGDKIIALVDQPDFAEVEKNSICIVKEIFPTSTQFYYDVIGNPRTNNFGRGWWASGFHNFKLIKSKSKSHLPDFL